MREEAIAVLLLTLAPGAVARDGADWAEMSPCMAAAAMAELDWGLPAGMLAAIGRIESGRWEPRTSRVEPWPWTVNVAGKGRYFASKVEAVADVAREQAAGVRSIDVGCFQVNLMHHPNAFADLENAFDPLANGRYAARFLTALNANAGRWDIAVGQYHSSVPEIGGSYRQRVMAALKGEVWPMGPSVRSLRSTAISRRSGRPAPNGDPYVIIIRASMISSRSIRQNMPADPHIIRIGG